MKSGMVQAVYALMFLVAWVCGAAAWADEGVRPVSVVNDPDYMNAKEQMQALVNMWGFHQINRFCIVGYADINSPDVTTADVYWPTQNKLIEWEAADDGDMAMGGIAGARDYVDLRKLWPDNQPLPALPPIPFLPWTPHQIEQLVRDCRAHGDDYIIKKTMGGWVSVYKLPQFKTIKAQLQYIVDDQGRQKNNQFCVVGQVGGAYSGAYIYWKTRDRLLFWLPDKYDTDEGMDVDFTPFEIDLKTGLRNSEDRQDNRDEMQRSYAFLVMHECDKVGDEFEIKKSGRKVISPNEHED